ncbi:sensor histidine kinase [Microbacterium sp. Marseille-Q6965]|uniref:sensor histidine kinase n=1 Tax=Microbacterium sp. Marseille-Q6965 TaxID=2965072 RepID=UPI0021B78279|nr:ATP-binding protein [Microbacterium sp. Marseille-Q6965]
MPDSQSVVEEAWRHVPQVSSSRETPGRFTRARFERILQVLTGIAGAVQGTQALIVELTDDVPNEPLLLAAFYVPLAVMIAACLSGFGACAAAGAFALLFPVVLVVWALTDATVSDPPVQPAPFYLLTVASAAGVVVFPLRWQIVLVGGLHWLYANIRLIRGGWSVEAWESTLYDVSIALLLAVLVVVLAWMYRGIAGGVDEARAQVVETFTAASVAEAAESERVEIAALMHDSVLAALLAAERADTPRARELAVAMAREALSRLANAENDDPEGSDEEVPAEWIAAELERRAAELGIELRVARTIAGDAMPIPGRPARAITLAATQALANAVQHADAVGLAVGLRADANGAEAWVEDEGPGVDFDAIAADRLGIRGSIIARMSAVGGSADIRTGPHGTTVTVSWQREEGSS